MPNDLDRVAAAASKNVEMTNARISLQTLLHETREGREAAPHVGMTRRKPNPHVARDRDHRRSRTSSTRDNASASTCASSRTRRRLPRSSRSALATATDRARLLPSGTTFTACSFISAAAICTGAKQGPTVSTVRACRCQVNTTLAAIPLRRDLTHLCAEHQRPALSPLKPAQKLDPHCQMTLKLDLRSHASRDIPLEQDGPRRTSTISPNYRPLQHSSRTTSIYKNCTYHISLLEDCSIPKPFCDYLSISGSSRFLCRILKRSTLASAPCSFVNAFPSATVSPLLPFS